jgi:hypothetical protein
MVRIALLVALLVGISAPFASACPPGPCNKYRPHRIVPAEVTGYTRRITTGLPRLTRARIAQFLTSSAWDPVYALSPSPDLRVQVSAPPAVRFVAARTLTRIKQRAGIRTVLLRRIEIRDGEAMIEVDGQVFVLERCDAQLPGACLTLRMDVDLDEPQQDAQFAKPPR